MVLRNLYFIQQTKSSHVVLLVANWTPWLTGIIYNGFRNPVGSLVLSLGIFVGCRFYEVFNSFSLFLFYGLLSSGRTWSNFLGYYCFSSWGEDDPRFLKYCCLILIFRMTNSHVHNYSYFQLSKLNLNLIWPLQIYILSASYPSQNNERLYIRALGMSNLSLSELFQLDFRTNSMVCYL